MPVAWDHKKSPLSGSRSMNGSEKKCKSSSFRSPAIVTLPSTGDIFDEPAARKHGILTNVNKDRSPTLKWGLTFFQILRTWTGVLLKLTVPATVITICLAIYRICPTMLYCIHTSCLDQLCLAEPSCREKANKLSWATSLYTRSYTQGERNWDKQ